MINRASARGGRVASGPRPISAEVPDWSREAKKSFWQWNPSRSLMGALRSYQRASGSTSWHRVLARKFAGLRHRWWSVVCGAELHLNCRIDGGLLMPHPNGVVIHPDARIGPNCLLMQQVTLGTGGSVPGTPTLVGHVDIGAGAKVLGGITLGAHSVVGANAVVLCDVPAGATAVGVPARIILPAVAIAASAADVNAIDVPADFTAVAVPPRVISPAAALQVMKALS